MSLRSFALHVVSRLSYWRRVRLSAADRDGSSSMNSVSPSAPSSSRSGQISPARASASDIGTRMSISVEVGDSAPAHVLIGGVLLEPPGLLVLLLREVLGKLERRLLDVREREVLGAVPRAAARRARRWPTRRRRGPWPPGERCAARQAVGWLPAPACVRPCPKGSRARGIVRRPNRLCSARSSSAGSSACGAAIA